MTDREFDLLQRVIDLERQVKKLTRRIYDLTRSRELWRHRALHGIRRRG